MRIRSYVVGPGRAVAAMVLVLAISACVAHSKELAGATLPDTLDVGGKALKLNGLGLRKKAVFKVYVRALRGVPVEGCGGHRRVRLLEHAGITSATGVGKPLT